MNENAFKDLMKRLDFVVDELLDEANEKVVDELIDVVDELRIWGCESKSIEHDWQFDMCGHWQHQYCINCRQAKYPELSKKQCGELNALMGDMNEEEYNKKNKKQKQL